MAMRPGLVGKMGQKRPNKQETILKEVHEAPSVLCWVGGLLP